MLSREVQPILKEIMLWKVVTEGGQDWDLLLLYILFGTHETPKASTGFTLSLTYRVLEAHHLGIEEEVECMLRKGSIKSSNSPWSSTIEVVPKPDGNLVVAISR